MKHSRRLRYIFRDIKKFIQNRIERAFLDADEVRLINLLGGSTVTLGFIKNRHDQPITIVLSRGKLLRSEHFTFNPHGLISFVNDIQRGIILGPRDILVEQELSEKGYYVTFVEPRQLWGNAGLVQRDLQRFILA